MTTQYYSCNDQNNCNINSECKTESSTCFITNNCNNTCKQKPTYDDYCKDPEKYKILLNDTEIMLYDTYCTFTNSNLLSTLSNEIYDFDSKSEKLVGKVIENMIDGMLMSVSGREMLALQFGLPASMSLLKSSIVKLMTQEYIDQIVKNVSEIGIKETTYSCVAILGSAIRRGIQAAKYIEAEVLGPVGWALNIIMLFGMLIDMWDPCDLKQQIGPIYINSFVKQYNDGFLSMEYNYGQSKEDLNKRITYKMDVWPKEFFIDDNYISDAITVLKKEDYYNKKFDQYTGIYISNSIPSNPNSKLLTANDFKYLNSQNDMFYYLSNKNTVIENFFRKNWPYILLIIILIIILIFYFIKKTNKWQH